MTQIDYCFRKKSKSVLEYFVVNLIPDCLFGGGLCLLIWVRVDVYNLQTIKIL